jgi:hypothetical protein
MEIISKTLNLFCREHIVKSLKTSTQLSYEILKLDLLVVTCLTIWACPIVRSQKNIKFPLKKLFENYSNRRKLNGIFSTTQIDKFKIEERTLIANVVKRIKVFQRTFFFHRNWSSVLRWSFAAESVWGSRLLRSRSDRLRAGSLQSSGQPDSQIRDRQGSETRILFNQVFTKMSHTCVFVIK